MKYLINSDSILTHRAVRYKDLLEDPYSDLCNYLNSYGSICAIVYCLERTACDDLAAHLSKNGISCAGNKTTVLKKFHEHYWFKFAEFIFFQF